MFNVIRIIYDVNEFEKDKEELEKLYGKNKDVTEKDFVDKGFLNTAQYQLAQKKNIALGTQKMVLCTQNFIEIGLT